MKTKMMLDKFVRWKFILNIVVDLFITGAKTRLQICLY